MQGLFRTHRDLPTPERMAGHFSSSPFFLISALLLLSFVCSMLWITSAVAAQTPAQLENIGMHAIAITSGNSHACTQAFAGEDQCWNANAWGQLVENTTTTPTATVTSTVTSTPATPVPSGICLDPSIRLVVDEGFNVKYAVQLCSQPQAAVTLTLRLLDNAAQQITLTTANNQPYLLFNTDAWDQPQWVTVSAIDDDVSELYRQVVRIGHATDSLDPDYQRPNDDESAINVNVIDNDLRAYLPMIVKQELPPPPPAKWQASNSSPVNLDTLVLNGNQIFVGERTESPTIQGIYRSNNCTEISSFARLLPDAPVYDLAFSGSNGLAATKGGKVYYSSNGGESWMRTTSAIDATSMRVYAVTFVGGSRAYAGADDGLYLSNDNGVTWSKVLPAGASGPTLLNELYYDPASNLLWIATYGNAVWKLTPGSNNFTQVVDGLVGVNTDRRVWDVVVSNETIYLATANGVYKGSGSSAWVADGLPGIQVLTFEVVDDRLYAGSGSQTSGTGLWLRDLTGAQAWQQESGLPATLTVRDLHFDGTGSCGVAANGQKSLFAATNDGVWVYR